MKNAVEKLRACLRSFKAEYGHGSEEREQELVNDCKDLMDELGGPNGRDWRMDYPRPDGCSSADIAATWETVPPDVQKHLERAAEIKQLKAGAGIREYFGVLPKSPLQPREPEPAVSVELKYESDDEKGWEEVKSKKKKSPEKQKIHQSITQKAQASVELGSLSQPIILDESDLNPLLTQVKSDVNRRRSFGPRSPPAISGDDDEKIRARSPLTDAMTSSGGPVRSAAAAPAPDDEGDDPPSSDDEKDANGDSGDPSDGDQSGGRKSSDSSGGSPPSGGGGSGGDGDEKSPDDDDDFNIAVAASEEERKANRKKLTHEAHGRN